MRKKIVLGAALIVMAVTFALATKGRRSTFASEEKKTELTTLDNKSTQIENGKVYEVSAERLEEFKKLCESTTHELYLNEGTLGIQILDKQTGFVYTSTGTDVEGMNETWSNFMYSGVTVEYADKKNKVIRKPLTLSDAKIGLTKRSDGFDAEITYQEAGITLKLSVTLEGEDLVVQVPEESIKETGEYKLQTIYLYPFLGATKGTQNNGYFFVPDGCGALIRTNQEELLVTSPYVKRVYGNDFGMGDFTTSQENSLLKDPKQIYIPIYGIVLQQGEDKGQGFAAVLEEGEEYADLEAYVSGLSGPYNFMTAKFVYRQIYKQAVDQNGTVMLTNQEKYNKTGIRTRYHFLSGKQADYVGIANFYRNYLIENEALTPSKKQETIPMKLEFLASELESGMFGYSTIVMTEIKDMQQIIKELKESGIQNQTVVVSGYGKEGASGSMPSKVKLTGKIGSRSEWDNFVSQIHQDGNRVELYIDEMKAFKTGGNYSQGKDVVQGINKELVNGFRYGLFYYLNSSFVAEQLKTEGKSAEKLKVDGIAVDTSGFSLFSNWNKKNTITRKEAKEQLKESAKQGIEKSFYSPNSYLFAQTKALYDIPMESSQYLIFTDTVPFLQMVLKGLIPYYASASNFNADTVNEQLKKIEYGAYPSYYLTKKDPIELYNTLSAWLFTSAYDVWKEPLIAEYHMLNEALAKVEGAYLIDHEMVAENVAVTTYSNGVKLAINYNQNSVDVEGTKVAGKSFAVILQ